MGQKPLFNRIGIFVDAIATEMSMIGKIAATRVSNPNRRRNPQILYHARGRYAPNASTLASPIKLIGIVPRNCLSRVLHLSQPPQLKCREGSNSGHPYHFLIIALSLNSPDSAFRFEQVAITSEWSASRKLTGRF